MSDRLLLRRAMSADGNAVRALTREAYAKWVPRLGREPEPMRADHVDAIRRHRIDLLYADGALVGLIELDLADHRLLILNVAVGIASQGRGFGRVLLAHAEHVARSAGCETLKLFTNSLMAENIAFYRRLGYRIDGEVAFSGGLRINMSRPVRSEVEKPGS